MSRSDLTSIPRCTSPSLCQKVSLSTCGSGPVTQRLVLETSFTGQASLPRDTAASSSLWALSNLILWCCKTNICNNIHISLIKVINDFFVSNIKKGRKRIINFYRAGISTASLQFHKINQWKHLFPPSSASWLVLTILRPLNGSICSKFLPSRLFVCCFELFSDWNSALVLFCRQPEVKHSLAHSKKL